MSKKRPRSFTLSDDLIAEIDRRAALERRSRSLWLQHYLEGQLLGQTAPEATEAPIPARQPHCADCGHMAEVHDAAGCLGAGIYGRGACECEGYQGSES